jgi:DNA (cytosine-5)-methyltransferase 1
VSQPLVLSLFPGIGLLDMAFELEGFCVVRGPDVLWGGDIRKFHPPAGRFDGVIGGPPCQAFTKLAYMVRHNGHQPKFGNLIPEFERVVCRAQPTWFVMENVPDAPLPAIPEYATWSTLLNNRQCFDENGEPAKANRVRRWTFGDRRAGPRPVLMIDVTALENPEFELSAIGGSNNGDPRKIRVGGNGKANTTMPFNSKSKAAVAELCRKQGLPDAFTKHWPFTVEASCKALGNGVPLPMGRAIARAVREAIGYELTP